MSKEVPGQLHAALVIHLDSATEIAPCYVCIPTADSDSASIRLGRRKPNPGLIPARRRPGAEVQSPRRRQFLRRCYLLALTVGRIRLYKIHILSRPWTEAATVGRYVGLAEGFRGGKAQRYVASTRRILLQSQSASEFRGDLWRSGGLMEETGPSGVSRWTAHQAMFGSTSHRLRRVTGVVGDGEVGGRRHAVRIVTGRLIWAQRFTCIDTLSKQSPPRQGA
ncbi:hypothetical protein LX32DRAFT_357951 [Colletotrichum zoysiae]|uniref:Uncharacterized protein n=1 Tax=Colletotrichum zoysiae TaxID=1216348 RepID=A0AAD9HHV3_9PEZI|nr:hypothetical protein LX32DRAFT_357951 [Colletotrichum zoysiae]